ncbi:unnamed protein product [Sordaria macrospora k-hell]|uniref:WGS project CABT00000000 data, contig 2.65 n=1 Tax=Sordaria macrospora (strain ATCC MYA-333 / DSM 997 / K(L3346) / K-hell) TaxID=771870 RepID=F7WAT1_SORMK|nr:uncharacterized protein SMAC_08759 [Sordaria macrospora k-hell]CCC14246.1 unnamed protein product [Sordaria macrospora k-hell]
MSSESAPAPAAKKGYLTVFALPTDPSFLPPSGSHLIFNKWYNEQHIPDILSLGSSSGFRKWEYLAMYAVDDVEKARSYPESGLYKVPLEHEMLPAGGKAMEMARWEMGFWEVVAESGESDSSKQTDIIVVPVDSSDIPGHDVPGAHPSAILDYSRKGWEGPDPVRSTLLKFIAPAPGGDGTGYKQYLAVHEVEPNTEETVMPEFKTVKYKLFKKFGV